MNGQDEYEFAAETDGDREITGWCRRKADRQPVEVIFKVGARAIFSVTANRDVDGPESDDQPCGFRVKLDRGFWHVCDGVDVCTPAGELISRLEKQMVKRRSRGNEGDGIEHEFGHSSLISVLGRFRIPGDDAENHHAKIFSRGRLEAFLPAAPKRASEDIKYPWFHYDFYAREDAPLLERFVFVVIDDSYAFITNSHAAMPVEADSSMLVLPLPFKMDDVVSTKTRGTENARQALLFGLKEYLGSGKGAALVFDRQASFECEVALHDSSTVAVAYSPERLFISQSSESEKS